MACLYLAINIATFILQRTVVKDCIYVTIIIIMQLKRTEIMHNSYCCYMESLLIYCQEVAIGYLMAK